MKPLLPDDPSRVQKRLGRYQIACGVLGSLLAAMLVLHLLRWIKDNPWDFARTRVDASAPHAEAVKRFLKPLRYSGLPILLRPDVELDPLFKERDVETEERASFRRARQCPAGRRTFRDLRRFGGLRLSGNPAAFR